MDTDRADLIPYYRTMNAPLRRILEYLDNLFLEQRHALTLNQHYSFERIRRLTKKAMLLAQDMIIILSQIKINGVSSSS
jgi:hypothetical protein